MRRIVRAAVVGAILGPRLPSVAPVAPSEGGRKGLQALDERSLPRMVVINKLDR